MLPQQLPVDFQLIAVQLDHRQTGYDGAPLVQWLEENDCALSRD